jgi:signal peptidase I
MEKTDFIELYKEILYKGANLRIPTRGSSMAPFLRSGDIIKISNAPEIVIGDIILFFDGQKMVAHRVIKKHIENDKMMLVTKGDACLKLGTPLKVNDIMGKVIAIEKPNGTIMLDCKTWRIANYMLARHSLLSLLIYRRSCFLKRVLIGNKNNRLSSVSSKVLFISLSLFPKLLINFLFPIQRIKSKLKL